MNDATKAARCLVYISGLVIWGLWLTLVTWFLRTPEPEKAETLARGGWDLAGQYLGQWAGLTVGVVITVLIPWITFYWASKVGKE